MEALRLLRLPPAELTAALRAPGAWESMPPHAAAIVQQRLASSPTLFMEGGMPPHERRALLDAVEAQVAALVSAVERGFLPAPVMLASHDNLVAMAVDAGADKTSAMVVTSAGDAEAAAALCTVPDEHVHTRLAETTLGALISCVGRVAEGTRLTLTLAGHTAAYASSFTALVRDAEGTLCPLLLYNYVPPGTRPGVLSCLPCGASVVLKEPYLKVSNGGLKEPYLKVSNGGTLCLRCDNATTPPT